MSTKRKRRITKQVRLEAQLHQRVKIAAAEDKTTISKLIGAYVRGGLHSR